PRHVIREIMATAEVVVNLGSIRRAENRHLVNHGEYVSDGSTWGEPFTILDINPNQSPRRHWDYFVVSDGTTFLAEAWRKSGRYQNDSATITDGGVFGGTYPFWFYLTIRRICGS
ncbi:hypothetical protein ACFL38_02835, partial [Candidatus Omnitrophota bacterium]